MGARATWKGYLKISLVNIPIKVFPATESSGSISFNQLHAECQTRIQQKKWCPHHEREVPNSETNDSGDDSRSGDRSTGGDNSKAATAEGRGRLEKRGRLEERGRLV